MNASQWLLLMARRFVAPRNYGRLIRTTPGVVGYWPLNDTQGSIASEAIFGHAGTYIGSPTLGQSGPFGSLCTLFNGTTQNVVVPHHARLALVGDMTLELWLKPVSFGGVFATQRIIAKQSPEAGDIYPGSYHWVFDPYTPSAPALALGNGTAQLYTTSTRTLVANQWQYMAVTVAGTTVSYYLNGAQAGVSVIGIARADTGGSVQLVGQGTRMVNAYAAHAAIYSRALDSTEIARRGRFA